jgi:L-threonylcarbamoyladenylate synthase
MRVSVEQCIEILNTDGVVALPTETVYGLAARIDSPTAIQKIFSIKQRPADHPLIVHIADINDVYRYATEIPDYLPKLIATFWPGPLTVILKKHDSISPLITANQATVAMRMPNHVIALDIIKRLGTPLVAPSANRFCQTSPTCAEHVEMSLGEDVAVVDGGNCSIGIESTIIDATHEDRIYLLRPSNITAEQIANIAGIECVTGNTSDIKFSGSHQKHYAPTKPVIVIDNIDALKEYPYSYVMVLSEPTETINHHVVPMPSNPEEYASLLYQHWHKAANLAVENIIIERPPKTSEWQGIHDRITKAAHPSHDS